MNTAALYDAMLLLADPFTMLLLVLGIVIGNFFHFGVNATTEPSFESWDDELVMLSFNDMTSLGETLEALEGETK